MILDEDEGNGSHQGLAELGRLSGRCKVWVVPWPGAEMVSSVASRFRAPEESAKSHDLLRVVRGGHLAIAADNHAIVQNFTSA